ncbi:hypothetical protein D6C13_17695 [Rahnella woolbedingensis]|uniref:Uncharacterized protein n=1 Tax=Rahnella woolbedingensis TaxID=1510574 RepID=A0A419N5L6_9GAMM|nr:hypothetical protein D6C13_17695 [Rahnella woolbedingensis]
MIRMGNKRRLFDFLKQRISGAAPQLFPLVTEIRRVYFGAFFCGRTQIIDRVKTAASQYKRFYSADWRQQNQ